MVGVYTTSDPPKISKTGGGGGGLTTGFIHILQLY